MNITEKCDGECEDGAQCESENGSCLSISSDNSRESCNGKCIPEHEPCDGECLGYNQCLLNGRCTDVTGEEIEDENWKNCDGACIKVTDKCRGACADFQCESKDGSCLSAGWGRPLKSCNGKCIKRDIESV